MRYVQTVFWIDSPRGDKRTIADPAVSPQDSTENKGLSAICQLCLRQLPAGARKRLSEMFAIKKYLHGVFVTDVAFTENGP